MKHFFSALLLCAFLSINAQTENPRGIYRLDSLESSKTGKIAAPFDQYKICTDYCTLSAFWDGQTFVIKDADRIVCNYTGEEPNSFDDHSTRVFDSSATKFSWKWWSKLKNYTYFPENDWCTEYYVADSFSPNAKEIFTALSAPYTLSDKTTPLFGMWNCVGMGDELKDVKAVYKDIKKNKIMTIYGSVIFTPKFLINWTIGEQAMVNAIETDGKSRYKIYGNEERKIYYLSPNFCAIAIKRGSFTDYYLYSRITAGFGIPMLEYLCVNVGGIPYPPTE